MNEQPHTCPYCNTQLPAAAPDPAFCPRCGERFGRTTASSPSFANNQHGPSSSTITAFVVSWHIRLAVVSISIFVVSLCLKTFMPDSNTAQRGFPFMVLLSGVGLVASLWLWFFRKKRDNSAAGYFVLGNMACVALIVFPLALMSQKTRRDHDPKPPPPDPNSSRTKTQPVAPAMLAGLGWLPDDCNLVAGIHVAEILAQPAGVKLLAPPKNGEVAQGGGLIEQGIGQVEKLTGLKPEKIDHLALALQLKGPLPLVIMVVRTSQPYDRDALAKVQKPVVPVKYNDREMYQLAKPPGLIYCADPQTLVIALGILVEGEKELLRTSPRAGPETCPTPVRAMIEERLKGNPQIWWTATGPELAFGAIMLMPLGQNDPAMSGIPNTAKNLAIGVRIDEDAVFQGNIELADSSAARAFAAAQAKQKLVGLGSPKVVGPLPDANERWVTWQIRGGPEVVGMMLRGVRFRIP